MRPHGKRLALALAGCLGIALAAGALALRSAGCRPAAGALAVWGGGAVPGGAPAPLPDFDPLFAAVSPSRGGNTAPFPPAIPPAGDPAPFAAPAAASGDALFPAAVTPDTGARIDLNAAALDDIRAALAGRLWRGGPAVAPSPAPAAPPAPRPSRPPGPITIRPVLPPMRPFRGARV